MVNIVYIIKIIFISQNGAKILSTDDQIQAIIGKFKHVYLYQ
jgi:hypothetical protein